MLFVNSVGKIIPFYLTLAVLNLKFLFCYGSDIKVVASTSFDISYKLFYLHSIENCIKITQLFPDLMHCVCGTLPVFCVNTGLLTQLKLYTVNKG